MFFQNNFILGKESILNLNLIIIICYYLSLERVA